MDLQLKNKTALVTGSTAGIGFSIAKQLLQEGATVYINGRTKDRVDAALRQLKPFGHVQSAIADFSKPEEISQLLTQIPDVDILINNVGIFEPKEFINIPDEDWLRFFEVNVLSGIRLSRHYFPKMLKANWGSYHLYFQRIGYSYTGRDDSLWHDQNRTAGREPRAGGVDKRN